MEKEIIETDTGKVIKILNKHLKNHEWHGLNCKSELDLNCEKCHNLLDNIVFFAHDMLNEAKNKIRIG